MLIPEQNNPNLFKEPSAKKRFSQSVIIITLVLSLVLGSVSGGVATLLIMKNLDKFGFLIGQNNGQTAIQNVTKETIIESDLGSDTIRVVKDVQPSVVSIIISKTLKQIYSSTEPTQFDQFFQFGWPFQMQQPEPQVPKGREDDKQEVGGGSGFIVSADGLIITNKHVVVDEDATYTVVTNDGTKYEAQVLARDSINDLAVLKIEAKDLKPVTLGDSDNIEIGQTVIAIGNSLAQFQNSVTRGVVSGINRRIEAGGSQGFTEVLEEAIQTDAAINPGNSGGPLLNLKGEVIGINTAISQSGQLLGFAIPINEAKQVIDSIQKNGKIVRPFLGVRYVIIDSQISKANSLQYDYGALISQGQSPADIAVVPGSPADKAGLVANDIILEINGLKIDDSHSLARMLAKYAPGDEVELKIFHKDGEKTVKVKLTERPEGN